MARALTALLEGIRRLTPGRWAAIVAIAAAITAVALLPSTDRRRSGEWSTSSTETNRAYLLKRVAWRGTLRERLAVARQMALSQSGSPGSVVTVHDSTVSRSVRAMLDTITRRQSAQFGTPSPDGRVVVVFIADSIIGGGRYTLLPEITDGRTCVSVVFLHTMSEGVDLAGASRRAQRMSGGMLGPCAFMLAFGPPGAAARQMLAENPVFALDPSWFRQRSTSSTPRSAGDSVLARSFLSEANWHWQRSLSERACAAGRMQSCRATLRDTVQRDQHPAPAAGVISSHQVAWSRWGTTDLMASMVREYGATAFARFWRADGIPEDAFVAATGRPIEEFAHRFWSETIGIRYPGPGIPVGSALLAVVTALAFVGVAVFLAPRHIAR